MLFELYHDLCIAEMVILYLIFLYIGYNSLLITSPFFYHVLSDVKNVMFSVINNLAFL